MSDCSRLWPTDPVLQQRLYGHLAGKLGASYPLARPFLICLRGAKPGDAQTHELVHAPVYDDAFLFEPVGEPPAVFAAATHAYQKNSTEAPKDGADGLGDVGSVRPGRYLLNDLHNGAEVVFHITNQDGSDGLPAWRDFDHDGKLSPEEMQRSEEMRTGPQVGVNGTLAYSILCHGGLDEPPLPNGQPPQHRYSIGCFTCPRTRRQFMSGKAKAYGGKIDMVLVNVERALELLSDFDPGISPNVA